MNHVLALSCVSLLVLAALGAPACASSPSSDAPLGPNAATAAHATPAYDAILGTWTFALEASDVAGPLHARCERDSAGDEARSAACFEAVRAEASKEKIRFSKSAAGRVVFRSFGEDELYLEAPIDLAPDGPARLRGALAGAPAGSQAERFARERPPSLTVELIDHRTIALLDPKKGRLVYTKDD